MNNESTAGRRFAGPGLLQIAMPMGGIGAGCICLNGHGGLQDFSIHHKPATTALPDGHGMTQTAFALLHVKGPAPITRLVEGPLPIEKVYDQGLQAQGYRKGGSEGLPRFAENTFDAEYPFGHVRLADPNVPLSVAITGWSPFIPLDDVNSSIPCAILDYTLTNRADAAVDFEFSYHLSHPAVGVDKWKGTRATATANGVVFTNTDRPNRDTFGSAALMVAGDHAPQVKASWLRGGWFDALSALWREVSTGTFQPNGGTGDRDVDGRAGGSLLIPGHLEPGESVTYPVVLAWHFPNVHTSFGSLTILPQADPAAALPPHWRPFYVSQWQNAADVTAHVLANIDTLRSRTRAFTDALFSSTLSAPVLDAVSSNLAILKSPTVLRQENGNVWAWEGCFVESGCCHGTCTHVWNYAQALPHLFPALERTIREQEFRRSLDEQGHMTFRAALPDGPTRHDFHPAADGQLGCVLKLYREWRIGGDTAWLWGLYPLAKRSLDYAIDRWDPDRKGVLIEPHHNTYDIEFWGADGMCSTIYVAALSAFTEMANAIGEGSAHYEDLAQRGAAYLDERLFNGAYYFQKVEWENLRDRSFVDYLAAPDETGSEVHALLAAEGPKYQYGDGCLSDGVIGAWMAVLYGVETPLQRDNVRSHLRAVFQHNFKPDLSEHACTQRPGYAVGHEPGLLLCTWPRGNKPVLPFVYSDEVWTGIEYQVASHLIAEGMVDEGLTIVEAARRRYDGHARNPFNEYECGSYYARAMASYALLNTLSGFRYDAITRTLFLAPKRPAPVFQTFFSAASGFGTLTLTAESLRVEVIEGELEVQTVVIAEGKNAVMQEWSAVIRPDLAGILNRTG